MLSNRLDPRTAEGKHKLTKRELLLFELLGTPPLTDPARLCNTVLWVSAQRHHNHSKRVATQGVMPFGHDTALATLRKQHWEGFLQAAVAAQVARSSAPLASGKW